jgi:hypothetical protein
MRVPKFRVLVPPAFGSRLGVISWAFSLEDEDGSMEVGQPLLPFLPSFVH